MRILLTNDDGFSSPGIALLARALRGAGHRVFVIAPDSDRSGVSHSISFLSRPCKLTEIEKDTWSCSGTPVDCVVVGLLGGIPELSAIDKDSGTPPDVVLSGINRGANIGTDILYSGTVAAARQGCLIGIPSVALSLVEKSRESEAGPEWHWETAASFIREHLEEFLSFWKANTLVNVNIPNREIPPSTLVPAFPSLRYYNDRIEPFAAPDGGIYCFARTGTVGAKPEQGSDWDVVLRNEASISLIFVHPVTLEEVQVRKG